MKRLLLVTLLVFYTSSVFATHYVKVGVLAYRGTYQALTRWSPTVKLLEDKMPDHQFVLIPLSLDQLQQAVIHKDLDFVLANSGFYYAMKKYGLKPLTSIINEVRGKGYDRFGAVIFTRRNRDDINALADIRGKHFAAVDIKAFGGFQMAWREFKKIGVDPFTDFKPLDFVGIPMDKIVYMVRDGVADAGTVRTDLLERLADNGKINLSEFKILNQQHEKGFPFLLSTPLYPDWVFSQVSGTHDELAGKVRDVLRNIDKKSEAAVKGKYIGWTSEARMDDLLSMSLEDLTKVSVDNKYKRIDQMMKELKIGPYKAEESSAE